MFYRVIPSPDEFSLCWLHPNRTSNFRCEELAEEAVGEALSRAFTIIGAKKLKMGFTVEIVLHKNAPLILIARAQEESLSRYCRTGT
jgi:hypothetical protein